MKYIKQLSVMVIGVIATLFLPLNAMLVLADSNSFTRDSIRLGCIARQPGKAKFMEDAFHDKEAIGKASLNAHHLRGIKIIDPCLFGQLRNLPVATYAALAERRPEKFQPLEVRDPSIILHKHKEAAANLAPEYHYTWIDEVLPPEALFFDATTLTNNNRVYGNVYTLTNEALVSNLAVFHQGTLTILQEGFYANNANQHGTVGGYVITDSENYYTQAALFHKNKIHLIPRLPGEIISYVMIINDRNMALVYSLDENYDESIALYDKGKVIPLDFGPDIPLVLFVSGMNNQGIISGTTKIDGLGDRGFRFNARTGMYTLLEPLSSERNAWAMGINDRGEIVGYSFDATAERIGVWDKKGTFNTYFTQGTPEFPTISNRLMFNNNNTIVITQVSSPDSEVGSSYLVPKPGVRKNLAGLVKDLPPEHGLIWSVNAINNHGNMIGYSGLAAYNISANFLLKRKRASAGKK